ncbi:hypothetical protein QVD17_14198 [Tagetes erecta]|uniref:Uncharacterized protein n=1 Tax=Tagetes erecta TaxID=13708 RepID=A0AAD8KXW8_TARER|nr:hypothetical protein QVD17_14198 [Tagetes erecta]
METKEIDITYKEIDDNRVNNETKEDDETKEHISVESIGEDDDALAEWTMRLNDLGFEASEIEHKQEQQARSLKQVLTNACKVFDKMYSMKIAQEVMIVRALRLPALVQAIRPHRSSACFASVSTPPEGGSDGVGEKAKKTMDDVLGATKDTSQKLKERVTGTETGTSKPSRNPELNHGVESTDSSCEDVRGRPGGYS